MPLGSGGSRLLRGNDPEHEALEAEAAAFFGAESALFFSTEFAANAALIATLPQRGDLVVHDELIHASIHEGLRLTRAEARAAPHNDAQGFADAIALWRARGGLGRVWLAFESLYSMEGDQAPIDDLVSVAERHDAVLLIDEAHATGVFGPDGRGLAAHLGGRDDARVMAIAAALQGQDFDVRGIRPPTVPAGTSRLRVSLTLNATPTDVDALADALARALERA